jgi:hypothetical protein
MLKKVSAALIAVSLLAAPAMAAGTKKSDTAAPATTQTAPAAKTDVKTDVKADVVKPSVRKASVKTSRHHRHYAHYRSHKKMSAGKTNKVSKATIKPVTPATKRG